MLLVRASAEIMSMDKQALEKIEAAGRTCYKSEDKIKPDSADVFVRAILKRGHESVIEHSSATVRFIVDRGVSHEIVRHRLASYSQESTRYCDCHNGDVAFVIPPWASVGDHMVALDFLSNAWMEAMASAE